MTSQPTFRPQPEPFTWEGVEALVYKENDNTFLDVSRRVLAGAATDQGVELRYFEVGPGGHTTLEHHEHTHVVVPIRGLGRALVVDRVVDLHPHDLVFIPAWGWHQFQTVGDEPFGFLCMVTCERDRPVLPDADQLAVLASDPEIAGFIRH